ncbi:MAG TPA: response regulator [Oligoflexia bacterium]|nr:response regulator [Oligoflexia bacterium]HMP27291.1 response regulator [Oligoflexia bacterium]
MELKKNQPKKFLVIDDDTLFRTRLAKAIAGRGLFEAVEAEDKISALRMIDQFSPDYIILDLKLKNQESGLDLLSLLIEKLPSAKIIVLTGYGTIKTAVTALKMGAVHYLTKPVDLDSIFAILNENCSERIDESCRLSASGVPTLDQVEWEHINRVLVECDGNITKAAQLLGLHRRSLQRKLNKTPLKII